MEEQFDADAAEVGRQITLVLGLACPARDTAAEWCHASRGRWKRGYRLLAQLDAAVQALYRAQAVLAEIAPPLLQAEERQTEGSDVLSLLMLSAEED